MKRSNYSNFVARVFNGLRAMLGMRPSHSDGRAASIAKTVNSQRGLAQWLQSLDALSEDERAERLLRAAAPFRAESTTIGIADGLALLADQPELFCAVLDCLHAETVMHEKGQRRSPRLTPWNAGVRKAVSLSVVGSLLFFAQTATAVNIAPTGTGLMGSNDATIGDAGFAHFSAGVLANIRDGDLTTRVDNFQTNQAARIYGFVGISWPSARTELVKSLTVTMVTRNDGGWFGNLECPLAGHPLTPPMLVAPIVQVSTDLVVWTAVPATTNYVAAFTGHRIGENGGPTSRAFTIDLMQAQTAIRGIRVIGLSGGYGDGNGYVGIYELAVEADVLTDTDADGMSDAWEVANGLVVGTNDAALDADSDGLSNVLEFRWSTNPQVADTDGDGLTDGAEHTTHGTFPSVADTDGDGLSDFAEVSTHLTNPTVADTDGDGLSDGAEISTHLTLPLDSDSDDDGFSDGKEIALGTNPLNSASRLANIARAGTGIIGVNNSNSVGDLAVSGKARINEGMNASLIDGDLFTRADTLGMSSSGTASHAGVLWSAPWQQPVSRIEVTFGLLYAPTTGRTGGWFSNSPSSPVRGATLTATHISAVPFLQTTTDGTTWTSVPSGDYTTNYVARLLGSPVGGATTPEVSTRSAYFTLNTPLSGIRGIRVAANHAGFLAVYEIAVCDTSTPNDLDGDGLSDIAEAANSTAADFTDTDGDNASDFAEVNVLTTNPTVADTDGDKYPDGLEVKLGTAPTSAASNPANPALLGVGIIGVNSSIGTSLGTPTGSGSSNSAGNLTDGDPLSYMTSANGSTPADYSYVGALFPAPVKVSAVKITLATMNNGGWFGPANLAPAAGGALTAAHLVEPAVQTSYNTGTTWFTVPATSNYVAALTGHVIADGNNIPTTAPEVTFTLLTPATGITGIRIIGLEGGTSQPFVAASEFAVVPSNAPPVTTVNIPLVPVGNPGNAPHPSGLGAVGYEFSISPHEITIAQYCAFLNAVAASDPHGLYRTEMTTDIKVRGIFREGTSGSYVYHVMGDNGGLPIAYVSWLSAARFVNWLQNGQTSGGTENGVYNLEGPLNVTIAQVRQPGATLALPSLDEWYKAAYYDPAKNGGAGGYWAFANRADTLVNNTVSANYFDGDYTNTQSTLTNTNLLTPVGFYSTQSSAYGTFDQTGNVAEWVELDDPNHVNTGGSFETNPAINNYLDAGVTVFGGTGVTFGFRIVSCPPAPSLFGAAPAGGNANAFAGGDTAGAAFDIPGTTITFNGIGTFLSDSESFTVGGNNVVHREYVNGTTKNNAVGISGLGNFALQAHNEGVNDQNFDTAVAHGGWDESFMVNVPGLAGQTGYLLVNLSVSAQLDATGTAGSGVFDICVRKNSQTLQNGAPGFSAGTGTSLGNHDRIRWAVSTVGGQGGNSTDSETVSETVTYSVPVTFGQQFRLSFYGIAVAGFRSIDGLPTFNTADIKGKVRWNGFGGLLDPNGVPIPGYIISTVSGTPYSGPAGSFPELQPPVPITITKVGNNYQLTWASLSGWDYQLKHTEDLTNWTTIPVTGAPTTTTHTHTPAVGETRQFFRCFLKP